jgi:YebC/PmpR family DNA-binding regulatory protein
MGRIFEKRKYRMFARFDRMAKAFTRMGREIAVAVKSGGGADPAYNPRLRLAIQNAKGVNMPKDRIEAAIKRASEKGQGDFEEILYEAYGPAGIALMIECTSDNVNRTVANIRHILKSGNGTLGTSGSVSFLFERKGVFTLSKETITNPEELELELIDHGLDDFDQVEAEVILYTPFDGFGTLQKALEERDITPTSAELQYLPMARKEIDEEQAKEVLELVESLEADDDVKSVSHDLQ